MRYSLILDEKERVNVTFLRTFFDVYRTRGSNKITATDPG
jgi:hypothetical protein